MVKVTNNSAALQGLRFNGELVWIKPGESHEAAMTDHERKSILNDLLDVSGSKKVDPPKA